MKFPIFGILKRPVGIVSGASLLLLAAWALWFAHESRAFAVRTRDSGNLLFLEQVEALRAIRSGTADKYQERLASALRDQLNRISATYPSIARAPGHIRAQLQYLCSQAPDIVALARAVPGDASADICGASAVEERMR